MKKLLALFICLLVFIGSVDAQNWLEKKYDDSISLSELEIESEPLAAASLGQVHLAHKADETYAMKIQYQGVRKAIKNDVYSNCLKP